MRYDYRITIRSVTAIGSEQCVQYTWHPLRLAELRPIVVVMAFIWQIAFLLNNLLPLSRANGSNFEFSVLKAQANKTKPEITDLSEESDRKSLFSSTARF